jgi:hypothetical protein
MRNSHNRHYGIAALLLLGTVLLSAQEQAVPQDGSRGDRLTLKIAVMGPGTELYFWWGHIALIIEDDSTGRASFYDYGIFDFEQDHFFVNFARGRLLYRCGVSDAEHNIDRYLRTNRDVTLYTLDLPAEKKAEIRRFVDNNVRPENRDYYYHHFDDNCATRIRDLIDMAVDGQFKDRFGEAPGRYTLRQHVRRHTWFSPFSDWLLNFLMGQGIDRPITVWKEMFLPQEIADRIREFRYVDNEGRERNLVSNVEVINTAKNRPAVLAVPRRQWPRELLVGLVIAGILATMLGLRSAPISRRLLGISQSLLGLFFGLFGGVLFYMTFFSNHDYTYHNSNILYINPLLLAMVPLGMTLAFGKDAKRRIVAEQLLRGFWTYVFFGCILSMLIKLFPGFYQQNQVTQALVLPFALVLSFIPEWGRHITKKCVR